MLGDHTPPAADVVSAPPETGSNRPSASPTPNPPPPSFDPSRMIGIIKRKTLIKELAAVYHAECLTYCRELLELQNKSSEEPFLYSKPPVEESRKEITRPTKRTKKGR